jgi:hypothetical protein
MSYDRSRLQSCTNELLAIFRRAPSRHQAHEESRSVLLDMAGDPACLRAALAAEMARPGGLNTRHYPSVLLPIARNAYFDLVANCFLPLPSGETDVTANSIHHHGHLLLTTATTFGPGYEHWRFTSPRPIPGAPDVFAIELRDREIHRLHHLAFVDSFMPHAVMFPPSLTVTFALWCSRDDVTWRDHVKRWRLVDAHGGWLKQAAHRFGLAGSLGMNVECYVDYYPVEHGFRGMPERIQFKRGPNEDFLHTFFHILQQTRNEDLALDDQLRARASLDNPSVVERLADDLRKGNPVAPRFSEGLHWLPHMNFKAHAIERSLSTVQGGAGATAAAAATGSGR